MPVLELGQGNETSCQMVDSRGVRVGETSHPRPRLLRRFPRAGGVAPIVVSGKEPLLHASCGLTVGGASNHTLCACRSIQSLEGVLDWSPPSSTVLAERPESRLLEEYHWRFVVVGTNRAEVQRRACTPLFPQLTSRVAFPLDSRGHQRAACPRKRGCLGFVGPGRWRCSHGLHPSLLPLTLQGHNQGLQGRLQEACAWRSVR